MADYLEILKKTIDAMTSESFASVLREIYSQAQHADETDQALFWERLYSFLTDIGY